MRRGLREVDRVAVRRERPAEFIVARRHDPLGKELRFPGRRNLSRERAIEATSAISAIGECAPTSSRDGRRVPHRAIPVDLKIDSIDVAEPVAGSVKRALELRVVERFAVLGEGAALAREVEILAVGRNEWREIVGGTVDRRVEVSQWRPTVSDSSACVQIGARIHALGRMKRVLAANDGDDHEALVGVDERGELLAARNVRVARDGRRGPSVAEFLRDEDVTQLAADEVEGAVARLNGSDRTFAAVDRIGKAPRLGPPAGGRVALGHPNAVEPGRRAVHWSARREVESRAVRGDGWRGIRILSREGRDLGLGPTPLRARCETQIALKYGQIVRLVK